MVKEQQQDVNPAPFWDAGMIAYTICAAVAWGLPIAIGVSFSIYWASVLAVLIFVTWIFVMPCTCQSGGLLSSLVAMALFITTVGYLVVAGVAFIGTVF
jgi:hypothetical protein